MNKFDLHSTLAYQTDTQSVVSTVSPVPVKLTRETASRLIVLVPTGIDYNTTTRRIWELAHASDAHVQLLSLYKDVTEEPALHRRLVTMASLLEHGNVSSELKLECGTNWVELVKRNSRVDNMIVCFAEQRAGFLHHPLSQILQSHLRNPVYIISGSSPKSLPQSHRLSQILAWTGSIGIIAGSFLLQIQILSAPQAWLQATLLVFSVIAEAWLIGLWNSLFG